MKKLLTVILAVSLISVLLFSACASAAPRPAPSTAAPAPATAAPPPNYRPPTTSAAPAPTSAGKPYPAPLTSAPPPPTTSAPAYRPPATTPIPAPAYPPTATQAAPSAPSSGNIGLAAGGAKDIANFRENIRNNYLPSPTDVIYEGLFYDYYFDTGSTEPTDKLFSPSYSSAVTRDPISHQTEYYLAVGLNSGMRESDFQRKKLNLVIVLDKSGSMGDSYNQYYYDRYGNQVDAYAEEGIDRRSKMQSADESVVSLLDQLQSDDRFAIVTFSSSAYLDKPMGLVSRVDMRDVKNRVLDISAGGSTNLAAGLQMATQQFRNLYEINNYEYENRIIVLSDAQPNTGDYSSSGLLGIAQNNANNRLYTTVIGIGVDFNSQLIEQITKIKGANYYSVHSPREFRQRVEEEFAYMVTPLVFNLQLNFQSQGWRIEKVFGSPEANEATGSLMRVNTLFPSKSEGGETRGGLVLLKLKKTSSSDESIYLRTSYEDRDGRLDGGEQAISLETVQPEYFDNSGIRKGVLLSRYAALLKNWMADERQHRQVSLGWVPCVSEDTGIIVPVEANFSQWERQSMPLMVSDSYSRIFSNFSRYFESEMNAINDNALGQELDILNMLSRF
jgi:Ca-activated chloride channel family protein